MRLIDADALLYRSRRIAGMMELRAIPEWCVKEAPTIDAVPVVRCKDCYWRKKNTFCLKLNRYAKDENFCSYGEPINAKMDGEAE